MGFVPLCLACGGQPCSDLESARVIDFLCSQCYNILARVLAGGSNSYYKGTRPIAIALAKKNYWLTPRLQALLDDHDKHEIALYQLQAKARSEEKQAELFLALEPDPFEPRS